MRQNNSQNNTQRYRASYDKPMKIRAPDREPSLVEKYGDMLVVSASVRKLFAFLIRRISFLNKNRDALYANLQAWANKKLDEVIDTRDSFNSWVNDTNIQHSKSETYYVLGCKVNYTQQGETYNYSFWFDGMKKIPEELEGETLTLKDADTNHLCDQICYWIQKIYSRIDNNQRCEHDCDSCVFLSSTYEYLLQLRDEAEKLIEQFEKEDKKIQELKIKAKEKPSLVLRNNATIAEPKNEIVTAPLNASKIANSTISYAKAVKSTEINLSNID